MASVPTHSRSFALWIDPVSPLTGNRMYVSTSGSVPASTRKVVEVPKFVDGVASDTYASADGANVEVVVLGAAGVVADALGESPERLPAASKART